MTFDRKDFVGSLQEQHAKRQSALVPAAELVRGAAVIMDKLPRTPEWQRYCELLQGASAKFAKQKQLAQEKLEDPSVVGDDEVRKLRTAVFEANCWLAALRFSIELPAYLIKGGQEAEEFIKSMEKKNEATGQAQSQGG